MLSSAPACFLLLSGACGAAIISPRVLLTAFHCIEDQEDAFRACDHSKSRRVAIFGTNEVDLKELFKHKFIQIIKVEHPPNQGLKYGNFESHDFAMLILAQPVTFSAKVQPICLPDQDEEFGGKMAYTAGWGMHYAHQKDQSKVLRKVRLRVTKSKFHQHILNQV